MNHNRLYRNGLFTVCALLPLAFANTSTAKPLPKKQATPQLIKLEPANYEFEIPRAANGAPYPQYVALFVKGSGFKSGATILLDGVRISTAYRSSSLLEGAIPFYVIQKVSSRGGGKSPDGFFGTAKITVRNPAPNGGTSKPLSYTVRATPIG